MAITAKKQSLTQSMNPFVVIQLTSGVLPRFLQFKSYDESGQHVFHVTSDKKRAHQMPLPTAKAVLHKIKRDWPLAQIFYQAK
ncbi:hypothetical protein E8L98_08420 [Vibrio cholerae]|uniref:hypothetical protein n=1 Tax=Vibrio cholerae TaxID=666 RepID=UPI00053C3079|nr:hypothetical protein [Vibrio cholerae]EGR0569102.1 hypothetical protein [Vibrio cholerae]ELF6829718.1 hypothetical protein [Vibrio cholerae]MCX9441947.1 hypothetical protein [Vibrio cholerae]MCX9446573.1 hypothetical protein [Vibrio cholerae]GHX09401.1 hypothetical protein VCSRO60_2371 [Vibrio cholerae]